MLELQTATSEGAKERKKERKKEREPKRSESERIYDKCIVTKSLRVKTKEECNLVGAWRLVMAGPASSCDKKERKKANSVREDRKVSSDYKHL